MTTIEGKFVNLKSSGGTDISGNLKFDTYQNGRPAIRVFDEEGELQVTVSVNMVDLPCLEGHTWIKNYSENEGIMEQLIEQGILSEPVATRPAGYVETHLCKILG